ncbi:MAG: sn-glycerol-3-phosphate ABC transporter ATP-binding protein UgpC [Hyphomicrobiales bacterium]|nr:sn-glycerol-3-phosphate ABC transporter ATP-binding protein UgpC [Hyphomicrobiales bacterium]
MANVQLRGIRKAYGSFETIHGVDLDIVDRDFVVLVGPSGCGKSTILRLIAGLEDITAGDMFIDGKRVNADPPSKRGIAMVFQSYALYPHMSVRDNISFGLDLAKVPKERIAAKVAEAARQLELTPLLDRLPRQLSGGQRQRVAIGRAIVRDPKVFLFDEPLSNLDAGLRVQTRLELAKLHRDMKATTVYVTHDQVEAMTLADRIVVINAGQIEQIGTPMELYNRPANLFVAGFIGSPRMNFIEAARIGETSCATIGVRPEHINVSAESGRWQGTVIHAEHLGADTNLYLDCGDKGLLTVRLFGEQRYGTGDVLHLSPVEDAVHRFNAEGRAIGR